MNINDENEEIYRAVVERANDGIFILQDGKIKFINPAFANLFGYESEELIGQDFLMLIPEEVKTDIINN
ncbi:MAG: PAS domain S-box protein [Bacteroidales bacterium]|nr:PAS domain S-box protein [Bacteroidales bacterium]